MTPPSAPTPSAPLPLTGVRVVEFSHMVMGPFCGMVLADLGAEVIKVEPPDGDKTRSLPGSGAGFFGCFNRNKKSIALDLKSDLGRQTAQALIATADVLNENFKEGTLAALGLGYEALQALNPGLVYVSHKGFLPGPYEHRTALDEVVQMMGGLAYMTGPEGRPLRAGSSVNDLMGGLFGALGVLAALLQRASTGRGQEVRTGLYENNVLLVAQHMMQAIVTQRPVPPMPSRVSAWAVYDVFTVKDGEQVFLAVVSDRQWGALCASFGLDGLLHDERLRTNTDRVMARDWLLPLLRVHFEGFSAQALSERFEQLELPFAPIRTPEALFTDEHLLASGGLAEVHLPADASLARAQISTLTPLMPLMMDGRRFGVRLHPPELGAHTGEIMDSLNPSDRGLSPDLSKGALR